MRIPIRYRVAVYVTLSFAIVIVSLSYALTELYESYSFRSFDVTLQAAASSVANRMADLDMTAGRASVEEDISETIADFENKIGLVRIGVFDSSSHEILSLNDADSITVKTGPVTGGNFSSVRLAGKRYRAAYAEFEMSGNRQGKVVAIASLAPLRESIDRIQGLVFVIAPITILLVGIGSIKIARRALKPLERIAEEIDGMDADGGTMKIKVPPTNDEIERVAESFNALMSRVAYLIKSQRNFLMDASHELKTPLTVIQAEIEMLLMKPDLAEEERENLQHLVSEVEYASKLAVDLIYLSRLESASASLGMINPLPVVIDVVGQQTSVARRKEISLHFSPGVKCNVKGDVELLKRAFSNVVENAVKYSHAGGRVEVHTRVDRDSMNFILVVADNGSGINPDELPRVFDRFYRTRSARGGEEKGSGLGLSIARRIVEQHDGSIKIESEPGKGTTVSIELPLAH